MAWMRWFCFGPRQAVDAILVMTHQAHVGGVDVALARRGGKAEHVVRGWRWSSSVEALATAGARNESLTDYRDGDKKRVKVSVAGYAKMRARHFPFRAAE